MSIGRPKCLPRFLLICSLSSSALFIPGCNSGIKPVKPNTKHENFVNEKDFAPPATPLPEITELPPTRREKVVTFGGADNKGSPSELLSASNRAKRQQSSAGGSLDGRASIEINDENLKSFSNGANVLVIESGDASPAVPVEAIEIWKNGIVDRKRQLAQSVALLKDRQTAQSLLRESYYTEKDPVVREANIRPKWEEALESERVSREELEASIEDFITFRDSISNSPDLRGWADSLEPTVSFCRQTLNQVQRP